MRPGLRLMFKLLLVLLLSLGVASAASAQESEPVELCTGTDISGTVVAVDEALNQATIDQGEGNLCYVQLDGEWDHPITSLLGSYFDDADAATLAAALDTISIQIECEVPPGEAEEVCDLSDSPESTAATILSVTKNGFGSFIVEVLIETPEGEITKTFLYSNDQEIGQGWIDALAALDVSWTLDTDEEGNPIVVEAGDEIAAYHEDGWGFGQLVKAYSIASEADKACVGGETGGAGEEAVDFCSVTVASLLEEFESGGGWGALFKAYGKPALLGVGHVRNADKEKNSPPANACGYWSKQDEGSALAEGEIDPCADWNDKGKPDWAGTPGGKPKDKDKDSSD
jgi:hypothetical protein